MVVSLVWRVAGLCVFLLLKPITHDSAGQKKIHSFKLVLQNRGFVLYAVPWLIFSLIDRFARIYAQAFFVPSFLDFNRMVEPILGIIFVFLGGFFADRIGRKRIVIYGFVALGIAYASIGLAPYTDISKYFYTFVDGIAWGIFMAVFLLILWGDLSLPYQASEMYYTLGSIPFFLSDLSAIFFTQYVKGIPQSSTYEIFSIAAFFLFLAVLPLMYAPETLPERKIQERQIKRYAEEARKLAQKQAEKKEA
jgi:MFS family permease